ARIGGTFAVEGGLPLLVLLLLRLLGLRVLVGLGLACHPGDRAAGDEHLGLRRDQDGNLVLVEPRDRAVDPAGGEHLVADAQVAEHVLLLVLALPLRPDDDQPEEQERDDDDQKDPRPAAAASSDDHSLAPFARRSASSFQVRNSPRSIACRAAATRSSRKRKLCRLSSRNPRISCWLTRWRMYARLKREQAGHEQPSSSGRSSRAKRALRRLRRPSLVRALPVRAVRVGRTQSNMSTPRAITSSTPSGSPIPMKYRGCVVGRAGAAHSTQSSISRLDSPTARPPSANPSNGSAAISSIDRRRSSGSVAPCVMPNRS